MTIAKAVVAAVGALVTVLTVALADDLFNASDAATLIAAIVEQAVAVWTVWRLPNKTV